MRAFGEVLVENKKKKAPMQVILHPRRLLETMDVVGKVGYDSAFTFIYSKRSGTPAAAKEDQVPEEVVKDRFDRLLAQVQEIARERSSRFEGTVQEVLVESVNDQDASLVTGRMGNNLLVHFPGDASMIGTFKQIHLDVCKGFYYMGTPAEQKMLLFTLTFTSTSQNSIKTEQ